MKDLISIIVPVYNVEDYIERCLKSLVKQTYQNIEIIVINDGSPDDSQKIVDEFVKKYPDKVFSYMKENGGLADARNYGLYKIKGKYVAFIDSDDYVELDYCEYLYNLIKKYNCDVACCNYCENDDLKKEAEDIKLIAGSEALKSYVYDPYIKTCVWNKMYKRSLIKDIKFSNVRVAEDLRFNTTVLPTAKKIVCSNQIKYHYNTLNVSLTRSSLSLLKIDQTMGAHDFQLECAKKTKDDEIISKVILNKFNQAYEYYLNIDKNTSKEIKKYLQKTIKKCALNYKKYNSVSTFSKRDYLKMKLTIIFFPLYYRIYKLLT